MPMFEMPAKPQAYNFDAQENAVQKTLRLIQQRQGPIQPVQHKSFFPMFNS